MLRLPLDPNALAGYAAERGWMHRRGYDEGRALHHLLVESFGRAPGRGAFQPFRLLVPPRGGTASLYGYSPLAPETLRETARTIAPPEALALLPVERIAAKPMPEDWRQGQLLGFDLRAFPVVRLSAGLPATTDHRGEPRAARRAGAELDAFLAHVLRQAPGGDPTLQEAKREGVYLDWLTARLAPAAELIRNRTRMVRFQRIRTQRDSLSEGPDVVFHGSLRVVDPAAFAHLLARGVGRHCAYGFGMLLLRAPGRAVPER
jgi:CRISPR system Cascade subunit CasE